MGRVFELDADIIQLAEDAISDMIDQLGKNCRLVYQSVYIDCPGCSEAAPPTSQPLNRWITGGFVPGTSAGCTLCGGSSQVAEEPTEIVKLLIAWDDLDRARPVDSSQVMLPNSRITTKGYIADLGKIMKCNYILVQPEIGAKVRMKFERDGEPTDRSNIAQGRFFVQAWKRVP